MGTTIWVEVRGKPTSETAEDSSTMERLMDNLDALAAKLQVQKLSDFYDYTALNESYDDELEGHDDSENDEADEHLDDEGDAEPTLEEQQSKGEWFDAAAGLKSIRTLRSYLLHNSEGLGFKFDSARKHWPEQLMHELEHSERVLEAAAAEGRQFRLSLVP